MALWVSFSLTSCSKSEDNPGEDPKTKQFTVTFDSRGGSQVQSQTVNEGSLAKEPEDPTKEGSYFLGWCEDEAGDDWIFESSVVKRDMTLYAKWSSEKPKTLTVMFYSAGAGDRDYKQIWKMRQCASIGSNEQVNMTFEYKFSAKEQESEDYENHTGVLRMDLVDAKDLKNCEVYPMDDKYTLDNLEGLPLKQYSSNAELDMSNPDEISKFIKWSVEKHPADKYVLIFADHGGGWSILDDEAGRVITKGIVYDDNVKVGDIKKLNKCISAKNIAEGINRSGTKIDVLYLDACLMSAWENLYEYKTAPVTYVVSSMEVSYGGNYDIMFREFLASPESPYDAFRRYIDQHMAREEKREKGYVDMGIFSTSGIGAMTSVIKEVCDTLSSQINDKDTLISSIASASIGLGLTAYWSNVWTPSTIAKEVIAVYNCKSQKHSENEYGEWDRLSSCYIMLLRKNHPDIWDSFSEKDQNNAIFNIVEQQTSGLSLGDILKQYKDLWNGTELQGYDSRIKTADRLYNSYLQTMKGMSYINCNHKVFDDQPYVEVSPSVNIMALNEDGWHADKSYRKFNNTIEMAKYFELDEAIELYSKSTFSKETGWVNLLKINPYNPSVLSNDSRITRYYKK